MSSGPARPPGPAELRDRVPVGVMAILERARQLGFIGAPSPLDQVDHALGFVRVVEQKGRGVPPTALDLGSGGGLPGLVIAWCWPECRVTLLDANRRRTEFLRREIAQLGRTPTTDVVWGRAEELGRRAEMRERFALVTARSFGPPAVTAECGSPFLVPGGWLVVSEPPVGAGDRWPPEGLAQLQLEDHGPVRPDEGLHYRLLQKAGPVADRFPRRTGVPAKRPLF